MNFLPFFIAKRLYLNQNKNHLILLISILSKIGVSVTVFVLIISFSALNGFEILLNKKILSTLPHGIIQLTDQSLFKVHDIIKKLSNLPGISYCEPYITMNGFLIKNNNIKFLEIKSFSKIDFLKHKLFFKNSNFLKKKYFYENGIIISSHLAQDLSIKKNDFIQLFILNKKKNLFNTNLEFFTIKIINIFESNGVLDTNIGYVPYEFFNIHNIHHDLNKIELHMLDPFEADRIIINAAKKIDLPLFIYTWINGYKYIYNDIKIMKATLYLILSLLVILSSFSIASISIMTISKKTKEIAILRSIGANNFLIQIIFLYYGLRSIIISTFFGLLLGIIIVLNFKSIVFFLDKYFKDNILLNNIYYNNFLFLKLNISDVIIVFISIIIIGILANWYPAYYASRINPSKILKEY
ncbi:FtsX-like permease family protein [Buchnera aphidicola]|uniref:Lole n=1 Tax=Buchnera aphidicola str. USDA (Myzus persicae) TaxID=1009856 RepID=W0P4I0_BUCMP|nr:FtsX-like permease family protein [Buchnera aphidicola]AHG60367.1 Lole [Buchnera aphidicola str. USDA (Myzus persicae)]AHG60945.1 Lole [Buchnera aphidicola str. W106 (Myzus persicae)]AHG61517.1 Lole [Buchnera aphidicola str. G002 (Myzus persicae)]AHG62090.1 Lole [Buchnera aphidicola str. F009 (Myzus persicae)]WAI03226.1 MAG: FtsX-like permease family protein [Buchnera aphidicola (Myzus persicae)]